MSNSENLGSVFIIDDDDAVRDSISLLFESVDIDHQSFANADDFFSHYNGSQRGCLVLDIRMPGMTGLELQQKLKGLNASLPIIFITGHGDVPMAVEAMRQGAFDFLRKPLNEIEFLDRIRNALQHESSSWLRHSDQLQMQQRIDLLTERETEVFELVGVGHSNKQVATALGISERTVEVHRSQVMKKLEVATLAELVRVHLGHL